jgi:predicted ATPase
VGAGLSAVELRARRLGLGMSQRQLAAELGVTPTTLARWERAERAISNSVLVRLALDHLGDQAAAPWPVPLPAPAAELIGRDREMASLTALLTEPTVRLVTLTGAGGAGKTALALAALSKAAGQRADGACLVELALTSAHAHAVAEICVRLDGLPLALELAAAHGRPPSPADLLARLDALPDFPGPGNRDVPQQHRSLRAVLDWSYDLLDPVAQAVFMRLGVFAGGFDKGAAVAVAGPGPEHAASVDRAIDVLTDASLIVCYQTPGGAERLRLLEPVRSYARERLVAAGGLDQAAGRHAAWLVRWTEAGAAKFENELQLTWLDELEAEIANLRAALAWSLSEAGDADLGLRLAAAMRRYWDMRGLPSEARDLLGALLAASSPEPAPARLYALIELGGLAISNEAYWRRPEAYLAIA